MEKLGTISNKASFYCPRKIEMLQNVLEGLQEKKTK